jgi:hypothetical protein
MIIVTSAAVRLSLSSIVPGHTHSAFARRAQRRVRPFFSSV